MNELDKLLLELSGAESYRMYVDVPLSEDARLAMLTIIELKMRTSDLTNESKEYEITRLRDKFQQVYSLISDDIEVDNGY